MIDAPAMFAACHEFETSGTPVPIHLLGTLSGADVESPATCSVTNAPFGTESAGPDSVVLVTDLQPGMPYVVDLESPSDLLFYVVTGCSTSTGPSADQCVLFEDASTGNQELGTFMAPSTNVYIVVDYYASHAPPDSSFTLDVYPQACSTSAQCAADKPVCDSGECVECASSFDCTAAADPLCNVTDHTCGPGVDQCLSDDAGDPEDDGPAGATVLVPDGSGDASRTGEICSTPLGESDFLAFDVPAVGDTWDFQLQWSGTRDLDLEAFDEAGETLGLSYYEHPERIRLTYLAIGRYYLRVSELSSTADTTAASYTVVAHRTTGAGCASAADCAAEYRNQLFRGDCEAGACIDLVGAGNVAAGGACDSVSDCATGLSCPSFFFVADADTREVCAATCAHDSDCIPGDVCTTYLETNFCVQQCTTDVQCPTAIDSQPPSGPWYRLSCDGTGHCLP